MIKAVFFDVDGTLVSHKTKSVSESSRKAIQKLKEQGIKVFLSTGRHIHTLEKLPTHDIEFDGYIILNGQIGLDAEKKMIFSNPFGKTELERLVEIFNSKQYPFVLVNEDGHYINYADEVTKIAMAGVSTAVPPIREYRGEPLYQACVFLLPEYDEEFAKVLPEGCKLARWGIHGADIIDANGGKSVGMQFFGKLLGINPEEMMAFGDAQNDIDMIEYAGIGIAMGNAEECLKQIADDVTTSVDDDGVCNALIKHGLI